MADELEVLVRSDPNIGDPVQREHPQNSGEIGVGS